MQIYVVMYRDYFGDESVVSYHRTLEGAQARIDSGKEPGLGVTLDYYLGDNIELED